MNPNQISPKVKFGLTLHNLQRWIQKKLFPLTFETQKILFTHFLCVCMFAQNRTRQK